MNSPTYSGSKGCPLVIPGFLPSNSASRNKAQEKISHLLDVSWATLLKAKDRFLYPLPRRIYPLGAPTGLRRNQPCLGLQTRVGEDTGSRAPQSLPEMQLSRQPRLCAQAILPAGEWGQEGSQRAVALGEDGQWVSDLISYPALLLTGLHFLY